MQLKNALQLHLLGSPKLEQLNVPVKLGTRKSLALLAYLALRNKAVRRNELDALLWPEQDAQRARRSLRDELSRINKTVNAHVIFSDAQELSLATEGLDCDVWTFEQKLAQNQLAEAVKQYQGAFLEGFSVRGAAQFEDWLEQERQRLSDALLQALDELCQESETAGDFLQGLEYARKAIAEDNLNEAFYIRAVKLAALFGDRVGALRLYHDLSVMLEREFDLEVSEETIDLVRLIEEGLEAVEPVIDEALSQKYPKKEHNLPPDATPFIGRQKELKRIRKQLLDSDCHLLTLVGLGGIGKTRLARRAAANCLDLFHDGVWFVPLESATTLEFVYFSIATALNLILEEDKAAQGQVLGFLKNKSMLLVLDSVEHLKDGSEHIKTLIHSAPNLKILLTSRLRFNIKEEWVLDIEGMRYPSEDEFEKGSYGAIDLFLNSAKRVNADFQASQEDLEHITSICQLMGGLPLGIELAAARVRSLSCEEIAEELEEDYNFLATELTDIPERHRSLSIVFNEAYSSLNEIDQRAYRSLSVFRGRFSKEEAKSIASVRVSQLGRFVEVSLLRRTVSGAFQLSGMMRQYAAQELTKHPDERRGTLEELSGHYQVDV